MACRSAALLAVLLAATGARAQVEDFYNTGASRLHLLSGYAPPHIQWRHHLCAAAEDTVLADVYGSTPGTILSINQVRAPTSRPDPRAC